MGRSSLRGRKFKAHPGLRLRGELRRGRRTGNQRQEEVGAMGT